MVAGTCLILIGAAGFFFHKHALHFLVDPSEDSFGPWWERRGQLVAHIAAGTFAIVAGPLQFWSGLRRRQPGLHRWIGRLYVAAVVIGATFSMYIATNAASGWAAGLALFVAGAVWLAAVVMAFAAIRNSLVALHVEWMIRSYVMTFAFVTFRLINEYGPLSRLEPASDRFITNIWLSWVVPLIVVEIVLGLRRIAQRASTTSLTTSPVLGSRMNRSAVPSTWSE